MILILSACEGVPRAPEPTPEELTEVAQAPPADPTPPPGAEPPTEEPAVAAEEPGAATAPSAPAPAVPTPTLSTATTPATPAGTTPAATTPPALTPAAATPAAATGAANTPAVTAVAEPAAAPTAITYTLDPPKSSLYVQVFKDASTMAANLSHDHVVAATGWTGKVTWGAGPCTVDFTAPVSGLRNDEDALRKRVGYDVMLDDGQRADVKGNMVGPSQLDGTKFPDITFRASQCEAVGEKWKVVGALKIHGVSKSVTSTMKITADAAMFSAAGSFKAKTSDFGITPFSALLGALKNLDELKFTVDVVGRP